MKSKPTIEDYKKLFTQTIEDAKAGHLEKIDQVIRNAIKNHQRVAKYDCKSTEANIIASAITDIGLTGKYESGGNQRDSYSYYSISGWGN